MFCPYEYIANIYVYNGIIWLLMYNIEYIAVMYVIHGVSIQ